MVSSKEKLWSRAWRWVKTIFFVANMLASLFFVCAPPLLVVFLDLLIPSALLAAAAGGSGAPMLSVQLRSYRFGASFVDLPLLSAARSLLLLCFYMCWSGKGPYLGLATVFAVVSAGYVMLKAVAMFGAEAGTGRRHILSFGEKEGRPAVEALFLSSFALAMAHLVAAYRTSCRERRKLLVYKIDIEAVSVYNNDFNYHKIALS
ncbi:uncharacterized protein LOC110113016 [Dendrobium catenatum]|uniref:MENTAL domain-containing protein n=1 Tax=Dendrobium catenatum TaxID=906689 RepID=A0A2I0WEW7_9ASPA|nr:uncharacterized protein LOC110113016 [Dendrobium catenatum]PKU74214.1 hypothetical protein MA16_Dca021618 [Dendrobium catenatum]